MEIKLLPPDPDLANLYMELRQDPMTQKYNPLAPATIEDLRWRISNAGFDLTEYEKFGSYFWFIGLGADITGFVSLDNINHRMLTTEIGCVIDKAHRGKGLATAAIRLVTENVFKYTKLRKIIGHAHEDNVYSRKMMVNLGYHEEGLLREHYLINGEPANQIIYGGLIGDFQKK